MEGARAGRGTRMGQPGIEGVPVWEEARSRPELGFSLGRPPVRMGCLAAGSPQPTSDLAPGHGGGGGLRSGGAG